MAQALEKMHEHQSEAAEKNEDASVANANQGLGLKATLQDNSAVSTDHGLAFNQIVPPPALSSHDNQTVRPPRKRPVTRSSSSSSHHRMLYDDESDVPNSNNIRSKKGARSTVDSGTQEEDVQHPDLVEPSSTANEEGGIVETRSRRRSSRRLTSRS